MGLNGFLFRVFALCSMEVMPMKDNASLRTESSVVEAAWNNGSAMQRYSAVLCNAVYGSFISIGKLTRDRSWPMKFLIIFQKGTGSFGQRNGSSDLESSE